MTDRRDEVVERVVSAALAVRDEAEATTPDGGQALGRLRAALAEADRVEQPGETERDRRLKAAALSVDLGDPGAVGQLLAALADPVPAIEWSGAGGDTALPDSIISKGAGCVLPAGEVAILAGSGGGGKSRLTLQIAVAAASARDGFMVRPFERVGGALRPGAVDALAVCGGAVVVAGYEDRLPWVRRRLRGVSEWLGVGEVDPARLSIANLDSPLFAVPAGERRDALPIPTATYSGLWARVVEVDARLVVIDPVALALEVASYDSAPVGRFMAALRRDALARLRRLACRAFHERRAPGQMRTTTIRGSSRARWHGWIGRGPSWS